jgi:hypothetical protein
MKHFLSFRYFLFFCFISKAFCSFVGNPTNPKIFKEALILKNKHVQLRAGYLFSNIYRAKYRDDILLEDSTSTFLKLRTQSGLIIFNLQKSMDIYTLLGNSKLTLDDQVFTNNNFSWGVGFKMILFQKRKFDLAIGGKYFRTKQNCNNFKKERKIYPILTPHFGFLYEEFQASAAISYKTTLLIPYIGFTYLYSTLKPQPLPKGLFRCPAPYEHIIGDFISRKSKNVKNWGVVVGTAIISKNTFNVNAESRFFDQNAVNITCEIRF